MILLHILPYYYFVIPIDINTFVRHNFSSLSLLLLHACVFTTHINLYEQKVTFFLVSTTLTVDKPDSTEPVKKLLRAAGDELSIHHHHTFDRQTYKSLLFFSFFLSVS